MGTKLEPAPNDCYARALPDEPMFVLLARDPSAPRIVSAWALERMRAIQRGDKPDSDGRMAEEALECAQKMAVWRAMNAGTPEIGDIAAIPPRWKTETPPPAIDPALLARREIALLDFILQHVGERRLKQAGEFSSDQHDLDWVIESLDNLKVTIFTKFPELNPNKTQPKE